MNMRKLQNGKVIDIKLKLNNSVEDFSNPISPRETMKKSFRSRNQSQLKYHEDKNSSSGET